MKTLTKELLTTSFTLENASQFDIERLIKLASGLTHKELRKQINPKVIEDQINNAVKPYVDQAEDLAKQINVLVGKLEKIQDKAFTVLSKQWNGGEDVSSLFDVYEGDLYINLEKVTIDFTPCQVEDHNYDHGYRDAVTDVIVKRKLLNQPFTLQMVVNDAVKYIREKYQV